MFALARTLRKSTKKPSERASRASRATDHARNTICSTFQASKWSPRAPRSASRGVLRPSWSLWGRSWGALGRSWGALGAMLALSCKKTSKKSKGIRNFGPTWEAKWKPKSLKIDVKSQYVFRHLFFTIFFKFSCIFGSKFQWFFDRFLDL